MILKYIFRKMTANKFFILIVCFIFLFSMGFIAGHKLINKSNNKIAENTTLESSKNNNKVDNPANQNKTPTSKNINNENITSNEVTPKVKEEIKETPSTKPLDTSKKVAYLTFDDGPTKKITPRILKTLDDYNVKATFFLLGKNAKRYPELVKEEKTKGHSIGNHTYCHEYKYLYNNPSNFLKDLKKNEQVLTSILGKYDGKIIRFPGGSFFNKKIPFKEAANKAGYTYIDWNALNGDAEHLNVPANKLINRLKDTTKSRNRVVILMHDAATKATTADALPKIIEYLKSQGYEFRTLDEQGNIPSNIPSVHSPKN